MAKPKGRKRSRDKNINGGVPEPDSKKSKKWTNKQRVLVFCQRGINHRARHLMLDLRSLLPHSRADNKLDRKDEVQVVNEVCELKNCNRCIFFQMRRKQDLFLWMSCVPHGPSVKFQVENTHTMDELKLTGNCLKGSRPLLSFEKAFDSNPQNKLLKELFTQIFSTPNLHPKSKPFFDHVFNFSIVDNRIWFRNYQIVNQNDFSLTEIGPRFVLNPIRIFSGSFGGSTIYENPHYVSPNEHRRQLRKQASYKYVNRQVAQEKLEKRRSEMELPIDELDTVFHTITEADVIAAKNQGK
eukprot:Seg2908.2 transcript_id=Seg2908.2/GoldUCD/mRNA.D3Y31 product="Ribosome biogenesis protein BRX1" protein_id=Seg2908.2/GoldUCD/D3Y31